MSDDLPSTPQLDLLTRNLLNQSIHQSFEPDQHPHRHNQSTNQSINQSINQYVAHSIKHNRLIDAAQFFYQLVHSIQNELIINHSNHLVNQSIYLLHHQSHLSNLIHCLSMMDDDALAYQSINQSVNQSINESTNQSVLLINPLIASNKLQISLAYSELLKQSINQSIPPIVTFSQSINQPINLIGPMLRLNLFSRALRLIDCLTDEKHRYQGLKLIIDCVIDCLIDCWRFEHDWISERSDQYLIELDDPRIITLSINQSINQSMRISSKCRWTSIHYSHMLKCIFDQYDQSINQLRSYTIDKLLTSPMKLAVPLSLINQSISESANENDQSINQSINHTSFVPVLRVLMKHNRLDLAVWLTIEQLSQRSNQSINQSISQSINQSINQSLKSSTDGVEWNVLDDLLSRLEQVKAHRGLDQNMQTQIKDWQQQVTKAISKALQAV